jgi:hypothetical protein
MQSEAQREEESSGGDQRQGADQLLQFIHLTVDAGDEEFGRRGLDQARAVVGARADRVRGKRHDEFAVAIRSNRNGSKDLSALALGDASDGRVDRYAGGRNLLAARQYEESIDVDGEVALAHEGRFRRQRFVDRVNQ